MRTPSSYTIDSDHWRGISRQSPLNFWNGNDGDTKQKQSAKWHRKTRTRLILTIRTASTIRGMSAGISGGSVNTHIHRQNETQNKRMRYIVHGQGLHCDLTGLGCCETIIDKTWRRHTTQTCMSNEPLVRSSGLTRRNFRVPAHCTPLRKVHSGLKDEWGRGNRHLKRRNSGYIHGCTVNLQHDYR